MWRNEVGYELQLGLDVLYDEGDGHFVIAAARDDDIGVGHQRCDVVFERRFHEARVLLQNALQFPAALRNVPAQTARQSNVRVRVHKHFHVQKLKSLPKYFFCFFFNLFTESQEKYRSVQTDGMKRDVEGKTIITIRINLLHKFPGCRK